MPDKKYVLFSGGVVSVYVPKAGQVTEYNAGKNKADFETFLVLGFGGRGHDLSKSFDVKYDGMEQVQGDQRRQARTEAQIAESLRTCFRRSRCGLTLRAGSACSSFSMTAGDYRMAKYNNIKVNDKLSNDVFKLKTSGKVTYVKPNAQ